MRPLRPLLLAITALSIAAIAAVSFHSVGEIHYLKAFYPSSFTVKDALYAALVEVIKVHIISLPLMVIIGVCLFLLWLYRKPAE